MMTLSHMTIGAAVTAAVMGDEPTLIAMGTIAAILPDSDLKESPAGQLLSAASAIVTFGQWDLTAWLETLPHRGPTHSILIPSVIGIILNLLIVGTGQFYEFRPFINAFWLGYTVGGCFPDCFTKSGAQIFYPLSRAYAVYPPNPDYRLGTGKRAEWSVLVALICAIAFVFWANDRGGLGRTWDLAIGASSGAAQVYNQAGYEKQIILNVKGVRVIDRHPVNEEFILISRPDAGFIARSKSGEIHKIGGEATEEISIVSERITAREGQPTRTIIKQLNVDDSAVSPSLINLKNSYPNSNIYLSGNIQVDEPEELRIWLDSKQFQYITNFGAEVVVLAECPIDEAIKFLDNQWAIGSLTARIILGENDD